MRKTLLVAICLIVCIGCKTDKNYYIDQSYSYTNSVPINPKTPLESFDGGENYNAVDAQVYDSMCIYYTPLKAVRGFHSIMNLKTGEEIGCFGLKGNGPLESTNFYPINKMYTEGGMLKADFIDANKNRLFVWNISKSISDTRSVYDTIIPLDGLKNLPSPIGFYHRLNEDNFFVRTITRDNENAKQLTSPSHNIYSYSDLSLLRSYEIYTDSIIKYDYTGVWLPRRMTEAKYTANSKRQKVAMAMAYYPQINILDITSGDLQCFRIKELPEPSITKEIIYYSSIDCDDNFIYALYFELASDASTFTKTFIHIFDWDGKLIKNWELGKVYHDISVYDNKLYAFNLHSGEIDLYLVE